MSIGLASFAQAPAANGDGAPLRTPEELDQILAPIALYPDLLLAIILPAATTPDDIVSAANMLNANGDPNQSAGEPWSDSVKALTHYPELVKWMSENLAWTQAAGVAFLAQPADVMASIQQLRAQALAAGTLKDTPQQQVIMDGDEIRIVPAQPDVIYLPSYDPDLVYEDQGGSTGPWLSFGVGFVAGAWLNCDLDWDHHGVWVGQWHRGMDYHHPAWRDRSRGGAPGAGHVWRPAPGRRPVTRGLTNHPAPTVPRPRPIAGAPSRAPRPTTAPGIRPTNPGRPVRPDLRGYPPTNQGRPAVARPAAATVFGSYNRGSDARAASQRGQSSRQQVRASAPSVRSSAPAPQTNSSGSNRRRN